MKNERIFLSSPHISGKEIDYVKEAFLTNWIAPLGPHVNLFEKELSQFTGSKGAVAVNSGTAGIHLALKLLNVGKGDNVFCSTFTFVASANPILYEGATPVFIDSEPSTWNMSPQALKKAFEDAAREGKLPKAVIIVNLYGQSADMDPLLSICEEYHVPVIEDAAESLGATYKGKASGTMGKFGVYSFNGNKIITSSGGGMLVSDDEEALEKARFWATQSRERTKHYEHQEIGYNYRLSNVSAGIGRAQLRVLENRVNARRQVYKNYYSALSNYKGITFMPEASYGRSTRWLTVMTMEKQLTGVTPLDLINRLEEENIEARQVWKPMHLQPLFKNYRYYPHHPNESVSDLLFEKGICLPSGSNLTIDQQSRVINCINSFNKNQEAP
ncbi:aminotransferase class I/II-fold pyridoxal phosphate-dependent enzyme [Metabacillus idriensis]|uniref:Aminotransferase class I/II-fold pyridoxal phosphate-dependent enzyme n=1 Tax=Metabacillus idriensis TaxID=324768 RepID=A0A6I2MDJ7_9BACI|nr:aminotransferase class I/II-fold pyridoxal phosphate-dependent enzyme [Metabacillus idriensis]MCM3596580.1 aminotransferase class I/II-fold pyridoxal phosphate-dependent enzyme [Metabacillus idriensis]MRX55337.1 aminotransferase class I/II-fold pyridoxal phosphate-dependent enzyme [Metabacillus idriensis]OHR68153.1 pyridoxal phosphate-dependent aminotransferase [Bacillus sp. HMSC76G11]